MAIEVRPQVEHHTLTDIIEQHLLCVIENKTQKKNAKEYESEEPDTVDPFWRYVIVDSHLREVRLRREEDVREEGKDQRTGRKRPIRFEISNEPASYAKIVGLAYRVFLVIFPDLVGHWKTSLASPE